MRVVLGNRHAIHQVRKGDTEIVELAKKGKRATLIDIDDSATLAKAFSDITAAGQGVWANHAAEGASPAWVASDNEDLAKLLASHFGGIEVRDLEETPGAGAMALMLALPALALLLLGRLSPLLRTNAGTDFVAKQMAGSASATAVAKWMGLTANSTAESAADTSLAGEITTAGGGLIRAAATYAHTTGTASYTLTNTFTANGTDSLPVTVAKIGVFDATSAGNLIFEKLITVATFSASGDAATITQTVTP